MKKNLEQLDINVHERVEYVKDKVESFNRSSLEKEKSFCQSLFDLNESKMRFFKIQNYKEYLSELMEERETLGKITLDTLNQFSKETEAEYKERLVDTNTAQTEYYSSFLPMCRKELQEMISVNEKFAYKILSDYFCHELSAENENLEQHHHNVER